LRQPQDRDRQLGVSREDHRIAVSGIGDLANHDGYIGGVRRKRHVPVFQSPIGMGFGVEHCWTPVKEWELRCGGRVRRAGITGRHEVSEVSSSGSSEADANPDGSLVGVGVAKVAERRVCGYLAEKRVGATAPAVAATEAELSPCP